MPNPNPTGQIKRVYEQQMAKIPLSVRMPVEIDAYVRSLPDRTEWLRKAIERQVAEDLKKG